MEKAIETVAAIATATAMAIWMPVANPRSTSFEMPVSYTRGKKDKRSY